MVCALGVAIGCWAYRSLPEDWLTGRDVKFADHYSTRAGEIMPVVLPDGSDVKLNTRSRMEVAYGTQARGVWLDEGEAYFEVAHNPSRPFIVYAGKSAVQAVGTAFSVRLLDSGMDLTVTQGHVQVVSMQEPMVQKAVPDLKVLRQGTSLVPLSSGQQMKFGPELESVQRIEPREIERNLAWRHGILLFDANRLEDVVAEINRYTTMKIVIADAGIRDLRFGGYFRVADVPAILATMRRDFGLRIEETSGDVVYLSRQKSRHAGPEHEAGDIRTNRDKGF